MKAHPSHDFSPLSWCCIECHLSANHPTAAFECRPTTDDSPIEYAKPEIDWFALNKAYSAS